MDSLARSSSLHKFLSDTVVGDREVHSPSSLMMDSGATFFSAFMLLPRLRVVAPAYVVVAAAGGLAVVGVGWCGLAFGGGGTLAVLAVTAA